MNVLAQQLVLGLLIGGLYGLAAAGLSLVFGVMKVLDVAHGELIMLGGYGAFWVVALLGIAPRLVVSIFAALAEINRAGVGVFLVEQNVQAALTLAHRAYLLESGRIAGQGRAADLLHDPHVRRAYLGPLAVRT